MRQFGRVQVACRISPFVSYGVTMTCGFSRCLTSCPGVQSHQRARILGTAGDEDAAEKRSPSQQLSGRPTIVGRSLGGQPLGHEPQSVPFSAREGGHPGVRAAHNGSVRPVHDLAEAFVGGVLVSPDDVATDHGCVEETAVAPAGRESVTLAAGVEALPVTTQDWQIYFVARYMLDA
ncbi:hypothetical protein [Streptomyces phaeochromogenes]